MMAAASQPMGIALFAGQEKTTISTPTATMGKAATIASI
jgi:hypothetical protein